MGVLPGAGSTGLHQLQRASGSSTSPFGNGTLGAFENASPEHFFFVDNLAFAIPLGVCLSTLSLLTFLGNAMVVHAIRTERKLHTVSNMFILSLAVADLTVGLVVMPVSAVYVLLGDWSLGLAVCQLWLVADYTASTASILNLLILSLDRYWSIRSPLAYLAQRTKKRALAMIALVWALSALWAIPIIGWHQWYNGGVRKHPGNVCETEFSDSVAFKLTTSLANFIVPMCLMVGLYCQIFREIKRRGQIGEISGGGSGGRQHVNRVSCAAHRNGGNNNANNGQLHSLTETGGGSFHTTSSSTNNSSGRRFFLKLRQKECIEVNEQMNGSGCGGGGHSSSGANKLFQRLLRPLIKRDSSSRQVPPHLPPNHAPVTENHRAITGNVTANPMTLTGDLGAADGEKMVVAFEEGDHNQQSEGQQQQSELCCSKVLISSPTSPPGSCSALLSSMKQGSDGGHNCNQQLLRDLRLEQLSRDNGHRIMKISSLHCKNCTTTTTKTSSLLHSQRLQSNIEQLLTNCSKNSHSHNNNNDSSRHSTSHCDTNTSSSSPTSAESKSSISAHHYHHHNKPPPLLTTSHRSSRSSVNFQTSSHHPNHHHHPVSVRSSASSSDHQPYQPKHRISSSASSLTSPTLSSSSSSPPTSPSSPSSPFQPEPSASSVTTGEGLRVEEKGEVMTPMGAIDSTTIAYYGELTLMSVQPHSASNQLSPVTSSVSVNISSSNLPETVAASASAATAANLTKEPEAVADHQAVTAPAAPDLSTNRQSYSSDASSSSVSSTTATKNLYSLQGDHFSGVNVTVEYVAAAEKQTPPIDERKDSSENCTLAITAAAGLATTTNTATMVLAQQQQNITASLPPPVPPQPGQANLISEAGDNNSNNSNNNGSHRNSSPRSSSIRRSRNGSSSGKKCSSSSKEGSKKAKHMKKSPSTISPNSDEIRNEALAIEREHSVGGGGGRCRSGSRNRPTCAMCGSLLSKSISQASTFSNVIVERPSDSGSVQTTASAQAALQGNRSLMSVPKHSTPLNSFSNLPVLYVSGKQSKQSASGQKKNHLQHLQQQQQNLSKASSWRSYSSFRFASKHYFGGGGGGSGGGSSGVFSSSRPRTDSIAVPANEFCEECACMASAVSAAARHRHALRREESSRLRQEKKAARQLGVILGAFIACWMPYIITYVVTAYCAHCVSLTVHQVTIWLGYLNSALNPCLYALCNENFKHAFKKMLGRATPPQHLSYNYDQQTIAGGGNTAASANGTTGGGSGSSKYMRASGGNAAGKGGGGGKMEPKLSLMKMCSVLLVFIK